MLKVIRKLQNIFVLFLVSGFLGGCIGVGVWQPMQGKPYTLLAGGDQIGRDQLANRFMVANNIPLLKGMEKNQVLTILGQPQSTEATENGTSEDWTFSYYKRYKTAPKTDLGTFMVRFYHDKVIDVVKES